MVERPDDGHSIHTTAELFEVLSDLVSGNGCVDPGEVTAHFRRCIRLQIERLKLRRSSPHKEEDTGLRSLEFRCARKLRSSQRKACEAADSSRQYDSAGEWALQRHRFSQAGRFEKCPDQQLPQIGRCVIATCGVPRQAPRQRGRHFWIPSARRMNLRVSLRSTPCFDEYVGTYPLHNVENCLVKVL